MTPLIDRVQTVILKVADIEGLDVSAAARLRGFGINSLRVFDLLIALEEEFGITIEVEDLNSVRTVGDLAGVVDTFILDRKGYAGGDARP